MCGDYIESGLEEPKYREGPLPNYNVLIIRTDSGLFGKSDIKYHRQNLNKIIIAKTFNRFIILTFPSPDKIHLFYFSLSPGAGAAPAPGVDCRPVRNVENDEQHGKHAEKYQVCPRKSKKSNLWQICNKYICQNLNPN